MPYRVQSHKGHEEFLCDHREKLCILRVSVVRFSGNRF